MADTLARNQEIRQKLIEKIVGPEYGVPDKEVAPLLVQLLNGSDKQILDQRRIQSMDKSTDSSAANAAILAEALRQVNPGAVAAAGAAVAAGKVPGWEGVSLPEFVPVPGQMDQGVIHDDVDSFRARME